MWSERRWWSIICFLFAKLGVNEGEKGAMMESCRTSRMDRAGMKDWSNWANWSNWRTIMGQGEPVPGLG